MKTRVQLTVSGLVQGVCYRMYAANEATQLDIKGWVRNLPDGDVELLVEGNETAVASFVEWCRQGPSFARVDGVEKEYSDCLDEFKEFRITR